MAEQTSIEWTLSTWNPVTRCRKPNSARADVEAASGWWSVYVDSGSVVWWR